MQIMSSMKEVIYGGEVALFLVDRAEAYDMMGNTKKPSDQHYHYNKFKIFCLIGFKWSSLSTFYSCTYYVFGG